MDFGTIVEMDFSHSSDQVRNKNYAFFLIIFLNRFLFVSNYFCCFLHSYLTILEVQKGTLEKEQPKCALGTQKVP